MRILIRQGEGAQGFTRIHNELAHQHRALDRELRQPISSYAITAATAGGDTRRLRGIPTIARGVTGAIPGTQP